MSGAGLIEMLAARLGGRGMRRSAPALREVLASAMPNRAPVTAYEPIASRLDDPMAEGAMLSGTNDVSTPMPNAIRTGPDAGPVQGENGTTLYRGSATGGRRGRWLTPDETAAADYGPVTSSVEDISRATPIRDFSDLELALGNRNGVLGRMDERNADVWDALDDPAVQQALRDEGHYAVRLMDDVSPTGRRHESYLVLNTRTAPDGGPVQAGRGAEQITMYGPDETGAYTVEATVGGKLVGRTDLFPHEGGFAPEGGQVLPAFQRQGVMSRILQYAEQEIGASLRRPMGMTDEGRAMWDQYASRRTGPNARPPADGGPVQAGRAPLEFNGLKSEWNQNADGYVDLYHSGPEEVAGEFRPNTFFSSYADYNAEQFGRSEWPVMRARARIQRPYDITDAEEAAFMRADPALIERARSQGYDALRMEDASGGFEVIPLGRVERVNPSRAGPNAGPAQTVGALPSATSEGVTTYRGENTHVRIQPFPRRGVTEVTWDVNGGRAPSGLADRARLEQEGIDTALRAMQQHAAQNGDVTYTVHGANGALARRYRRMAQERAEAAGFTFEETPSGGLIFRRADSANRSDGNALQRALRERMERE